MSNASSSSYSCPLRVLWDTGASDSYIDDRVASSLGLKVYELEDPIDLRLFDGSRTSSGPISQYIHLDLRFPSSTVFASTPFQITRLSGSDLVIGFKWMSSHLSTIDLRNRALVLNPEPSLEVRAIAAELSPSSRPSPPVPERRMSDVVLDPSPEARFTKSSPRSSSSSPEPRSAKSSPRSSSPSPEPSLQPSPESSLDPSLLEHPVEILAAAFAPRPMSSKARERRNSKRHTSRSFPNTLPLGRPSRWGQPATLSATLETHEPPLINDVEIRDIKSKLPAVYHDFVHVFFEREARETLPPPRDYDMKILLKPDAKLAVAPLYQLREDYRQCLIETLDRELKAGRIQRSSTSYGSPVFFVPKKNGKFRMVADYRVLNQSTIPDVYPLPLISQASNELANAEFFSKLDLPGAYQLLRVAEGFEHLTAFRTQYGMFESRVLRDGLRNAPAVFQHFLNDIFRTLLGQGVIVYIDDILIYASTLERLRELTKQVLEIIDRASLYLNFEKCEFERTSIIFLGFIISKQGIQANPSLVQSVRDFPRPSNLRESRSFIGLVSYYRRFIANFSKIARPITALTQKDRVFEWGPQQQEAFETLKVKLSSAPTIAHFDHNLPCILQTDASHFGWGYIISQIDPSTNLEHPIAIESGSFNKAELNYTTLEKELLAIVKAFETRRHMLIQVDTEVLTDHYNLTYWMKASQLSTRQARWVELLTQFRMKIYYRPGTKASMPDALSRRSDYHPGKGATMHQEHNFIQALPEFSSDPPPRSSISFEELVPSSTLAALQPNLDPRDFFIRDSDLIDGLKSDADIGEVRNDMLAVSLPRSSHLDPSPQSLSSLAYLRRVKHNPSLVEPRWTPQGFLAFGSRVYVPDHNDARLKVLKARHDSKLAGHPGITRTLELVSRDYIWNGLRNDIERYIRGCATCQRTKTSRQSPHGFLKPLEVPQRPWSDISMDFVEELPKSRGFNSILVVVDRLTKFAIFVPTTTTLDAPGLSKLFIDHVVSQHGLPSSIISDRGSKFISRFWKDLTSRLEITLALSTAFHPQTDGQTERVNQSLEQYLRIFASYKQDDWSSLLPQASFVHNNSVNASTKQTPFYSNFGYHPKWVSEISGNSSLDYPLSYSVASDILELHRQCRENIAQANLEYSKAYNANRIEPPSFEAGDEVLLSLEHVKTARPSKKLEARFSGPFKIVSKVGSHAYRLELPPSMRNHPVFHVSKLRPFSPPAFENQLEPPPPPIEVGPELEWEVNTILDSRLDPRTRKLFYQVEWKGYEGTSDHVTWEPASNLDNCPELRKTFHETHPNKPSKASRK